MIHHLIAEEGWPAIQCSRHVLDQDLMPCCMRQGLLVETPEFHVAYLQISNIWGVRMLTDDWFLDHFLFFSNFIFPSSEQFLFLVQSQPNLLVTKHDITDL